MTLVPQGLKDRTVGNHGGPLRVVCFRTAILTLDLATMLLDCDVLSGPTGVVASSDHQTERTETPSTPSQTPEFGTQRKGSECCYYTAGRKSETDTLRVLV